MACTSDAPRPRSVAICRFARFSPRKEAQHLDPQRLVMASQHRAGEVVEAPRAGLAAVALPLWLGLVVAVPDHRAPAAPGTAHPLRPAVLPYEGEALGLVHQPR